MKQCSSPSLYGAKELVSPKVLGIKFSTTSTSPYSFSTTRHSLYILQNTIPIVRSTNETQVCLVMPPGLFVSQHRYSTLKNSK